MTIDIKNVACCRVSSVINKDTKNFGKQFLLDQKEDTCWSSEKGKTQWFKIEFKNDITFDTLRIQFQGGFAGGECSLEVAEKSEAAKSTFESFYPEDNNSLQDFPLSRTFSSNTVTVHFRSSTDLFGRIIVYNFDLLVNR